jgi:beta-lactam-binding protein with PASTA domain
MLELFTQSTRSTQMKKRFIFTVAVLMAVFFSLPAQAQQVAVPNVVGMTTDQAVKTLEAAGLRGPISFEMTSNQAQHGKVTKQNPAAGQKTVKGSGVVLTAYMYQPPAVKVTVAPAVKDAFGPVMPNVVGMTFPQAYDAFKKAGLDFEKYRSRYTWRDDSTDPKCENQCVVSQTPAPGTPVKPDTPTVLVFNKYWATAIVPDLKNLTVDAAMQRLRDLHLGFSSKPTETARPELSGKVYGQSPAPGTKLRTGGVNNTVTIQSYIYKESALEVKAQFMPEAKTYLLMVKGGVLPYDVVASYDVPKNMAGQKIVKITPLTDSPNTPGWKLYRITNLIPVEAVMVVTDAKGRKHDYKLHLTQANK